MPYKDPQEQLAAGRRNYPRYKDRKLERQRERREEINVLKATTRRAKAALIQQIKERRACEDCGLSWPSYVTDFHHVRGEKVMGVSKMANVGYSMSAILAEIDKCVLLCANCHRIRHNVGSA